MIFKMSFLSSVLYFVDSKGENSMFSKCILKLNTTCYVQMILREKLEDSVSFQHCRISG